jgi:hypothetical protein
MYSIWRRKKRQDSCSDLRTAIEWGEKGGEIKKPLIVSGKIAGVQANYSPPEG